MKLSEVLFILSLLGSAAAEFDGTNKEFMQIIEAGGMPQGLWSVNEVVDDRNLRGLADGAPGEIGDSCGNKRPCAEGLDCVRTIGLRKQCIPPVDCINSVMNEFRKDNGLEDYGQQIMKKSGWKGLDITNKSATDQGLFATIADAPQTIVRKDAEQAITDAMMENPPDLGDLVYRVETKCPKAATKSGVALMLGFYYEIALLIPKFYNAFYFIIGTGDFHVHTSNSSINYNISAGLFSDACGGVGPDVGIGLGAMNGIALTGTKHDMIGCSFLFDADIGIATGVGAAVGVTSKTMVTRFLFEVGAAFQLGIGFSGCNTRQLHDFVVRGSQPLPSFPPIPPAFSPVAAPV